MIYYSLHDHKNRLYMYINCFNYQHTSSVVPQAFSLSCFCAYCNAVEKLTLMVRRSRNSTVVHIIFPEKSCNVTYKLRRPPSSQCFTHFSYTQCSQILLQVYFCMYLKHVLSLCIGYSTIYSVCSCCMYIPTLPFSVEWMTSQSLHAWLLYIRIQWTLPSGSGKNGSPCWPLYGCT